MNGENEQLPPGISAIEWRLWSKIRNRMLNGMRFHYNYLIGDYRVTFYCQETLVAIDIVPSCQQQSVERTDYFQQRGYRYIAIRESNITDDFDSVIDQIYELTTPYW